MDAARGPSPSLGATHSAPHDTQGEPGEHLGRPPQQRQLPAALVGSDTAGNLASGGFA